MSILPDPLTDLIGLFLHRATTSQIGMRLTLLLELAIATSIAFTGACGLATLAGSSIQMAVGAGLVATALAQLATFSTSQNAKGLIVSFPQQVMEKRVETSMTTIERPK